MTNNKKQQNILHRKSLKLVLCQKNTRENNVLTLREKAIYPKEKREGGMPTQVYIFKIKLLQYIELKQ